EPHEGGTTAQARDCSEPANQKKIKMFYQRSSAFFQEAQNYIPGGVNSPVRAFKSVGGTPLFMKKALGAYLFDDDGNAYVDYINSWGPMILGHTHPMVLEAVSQQLKK